MKRWLKRADRSDGERAETRAREFLRRQGLEFVEANVRGPGGEIDLVMRQGQTLVFVEVRLRRNRRFVSAGESVDARKQQKIVQTASYYLQKRGLSDNTACRFDVVALSSLEAGAEPEWLADAFAAF